MKEYIEREAVKAVFDGIYDCADMVFEPNDQCCSADNCGRCKWAQTKNAIKKMVMRIPAADVVVRCEDCKWRPRNLGEGVYAEHLDFPLDSDGDAVCPYAAGDPWYNKEPCPDGYCSRGQREVIDN